MSSGRRKTIFSVLTKPEEQKKASDRLNEKMLMKSINRHQTRTRLKEKVGEIPMELLKQRILEKTNEFMNKA